MRNLHILTVCLLFFGYVAAWDQDDLDIFDLVEEVNENFYTVLKIEQTASSAEVRKAFRGLSLVLHPDKNDAEDANVQFRNLVAVYEVLKDSSKREKYDKVLRDGLPDWKSALYYYRHYRKMGLTEMCILLFIIITIGQYIVSWAAYVEKKYTAESLIGTKFRKLQKKNKSSMNIDDLLNQIPTPSIKDTLPFQIPRAIWNTPFAIKNAFNHYAEYKEQLKEEKLREEEELEEQRLLEEELAREKAARKEGIRNRKPVFTAKEKTEEELKGYSQLNLKKNEGSGVKAVDSKEPVLSGGFWTDEDLIELTRLVKKYPNGTASRWEVIANQMNRSVQEVTFMTGRMKESIYRQSDSVAETVIQEASKKMKKVTTPVETKTTNTDAVWSQEQQKLLETAIVKYPKTSAGDRWQKIANTVPGKTKEECLARYKYLVNKVKEQKLKVEVANATTTGKQQETGKEDPVKSEPIDANNSNPIDDTEKVAEKTSNVERLSNNDDDNEEEKLPAKNTGGKPRNKRKERKKRMEFSSDEEQNYED